MKIDVKNTTKIVLLCILTMIVIVIQLGISLATYLPVESTVNIWKAFNRVGITFITVFTQD